MPVDSGYGGPERLTDGQEWPYHKLEGTGDWPTGGGGGDPGGGDPGGDPTLALLELIISGIPGPVAESYGFQRRRRHQPVQAPVRTPIPAYAYGTRFHRGGSALVGEQGPEVVNLPRGTSVTPNPRTMGYGVRVSNPGGSPGSPGPSQMPERPGGAGDYGIDIGALYGPNGQVSLNQLLQVILGQGVRGGAFDPLGSPQMAGMIRDASQQSSGARQRAAQLGADLDSGGDPALRAYARTQARLNTQAESQQGYLNALLQSAQGSQDWLRSLLSGHVGQAVTRRDPRESSGVQIGLGPVGIGVG